MVPFELPPLPYALDALEPHLSKQTLHFHYEKHHRGYLEKLNRALEDAPEGERSLTELVRTSSGSVFNNAAQVWNHTFYWNSMRPGGGGRPRGDLAARIDRDFGSLERFQEGFVDTAVKLFGSGYVWLWLDPRTDRLELQGMKDAGSPLIVDGTPLLGMDVWEHAYYLDFQNDRARYARVFLGSLVNWRFVEENLVKGA